MCLFMRMVDLIEKKRNGGELSEAEIEFMIQGYTKGEIPDYQMSAFLMATYFQNMTAAERSALTMAIVKSGEVLDLSGIEGVIVDKHSTGGVGDKTTIALAPLVASVGVPVAKMSGRGLGHTGGTLDKLESIPSFSIDIDQATFTRLVNENKVAVIGQTANLTPADKLLYSLRDVTATVDSIPLIASSIMSKKIASGAKAIVLDVKTGSGAFMKELEKSRELAEAMVEIGNQLGRKTMAVISDMNQPLGYAVGNALEVQEAIDMLKGGGPDDLRELCLVLGSQMVYLANKAESLAEAREMLEEAIASGKALETLKTFIAAQSGDASVIDEPTKLPQARWQIKVTAPNVGYVKSIVADRIGTAAMILGAGRATKDSPIDLAVGVVLQKKIGDYVEQGETIAVIHSNREQVEDVIAMMKEAYSFTTERTEAPPLIYGEVK